MDSRFYFLLVFLLLLLRLWKKWKNKMASSRKLPPGPWKLPIIGNLHQLFGFLPHHRLRAMANKYGPIMHLQLGEISTIIISSPEAAKEIMKNHDVIFASRPFNLAASVLFYDGKDIAFGQYGDYWRQLRKISALELLSTKRVQSFRRVREEEVPYLVRSIAYKTGSPVNLTRMLMKLTNCIISRTVFGMVKNQEDAITTVVQDIANALGGFKIAAVFPSLKFLQVISGTRSKLQNIHREADKMLDTIIKQHHERRESMDHGCHVVPDDLVHALLNLQDHGVLEFPLTIQHIKAVILDMFAAGNETSATVLEWAMSEIMKNPDVLEKVQEEVRHAFSESGEIDETRLHELCYLNTVVKETLRMHPPAPLLLPREAREKVEIWGYEIPEKTQVLINAWAIRRDPRYWTESERFNPDRFLHNSVDYKGSNFEFIPFGAGKRIYPGILFGISVVQLVLANLLYHFDWTLPNGMKPQDFDMAESFEIVTRRKNELQLIPISK